VNAAGRGVGTIPTSVTPVFTSKREAYGPVYFPRASSVESAQILLLNPGATINADFALESHESYRIRGQVNGMPSGRRIAIRLFRGDDVVVGRSALATSSGAFEMTDVAPGSYTVQVATETGTPQGFGETAVTVGTVDVSGVKVALSFGASITGRVIFDGATPRAEEELPYQVMATPVQTRRRPALINSEGATVGSDGKFTLKSLILGQYEISIEPSLSGAQLVSATAGGRDILAEGLVVSAAGAPELELHMQSGSSTIDAAIEGYVGPGAVNVLVLRTLGIAQIPSVQILFPGRPANFSGLMPGDYTLYAWAPGKEPEYRNQTALDLLRAYAAPVAVNSGETKKVSIRIIPAEALP
jgi:hypothetical protein